MGEEMAEGGSEGGMALEEASGASRNRACFEQSTI